MNLVYIRDFLGHSSVITTEHYAKLNPEFMRKAIEKSSIPSENVKRQFSKKRKTRTNKIPKKLQNLIISKYGKSGIRKHQIIQHKNI